MRKSIEIKNDIAILRAEIEKLQAAEQMDEAAKKAKDLTDLMKEYETVLAMENSNFEKFKDSAVPIKMALGQKDKKKLINRTFNKLVFGRVFGWNLTDEEKEIAKTITNTIGTPGLAGGTAAKGGYLIPTEQFAQILEMRRAYTSLKDLCTIRPATSRTGLQPTLGEEDGTLTAFDEINTIAQSDIDFGQIGYTLVSYGDVIPVSNELLQDTDLDLMGVIGKRFVRKAINTENTKILALLEALTPTIGDTYLDLVTALNITLDPAISAAASIITNQSGYNYLDQLVDGNNRPLLTQSIADPQVYMFKGRKVVIAKDTLLANDTTTLAGTTYAPYLLGSMSDFCHFFERSGVEVAVSTEAGFTQNVTMVRAIERFNAVQADSTAMTYTKLPIAVE